MNNIAFTLHRADQRMLILQRDYLQRFGVTPARYILLLFLKRLGASFGAHGRFMYQSDIWKTLGVRPATTSKMLKSLEQIGYVRRQPCPSDKREVLVFITRRGCGVLYRVDKQIIRPGIFWMATLTIFGSWADAGRIEFILERLRENLYDYATFWFPHCRRTLYPERRFKTPPPFVWPGTEEPERPPLAIAA